MSKPPPAAGGIRKRLLTASEAAEYLGLAQWTIRQWASMGRIPKVKLGRSLRFDLADLDDVIEKGKTPARERT